MNRIPRGLAATLVAGALFVVAASVTSAHTHTIESNGQVLADGQNHPRFIANGDGTYTSCESYGPIPGSSIGPAWYGLESAHHGPDSGDPGKGDGCYTADGNPALGQDDQNPAIK